MPERSPGVAARVRLVDMSATFTFHGRCETCSKRVRATKTLWASTLEGLRVKVDDFASTKKFHCRKHRDART